LDQWVHGNVSFLLPRRVVSAIAGLEEAKNIAGESPPPDSDLLTPLSLKKARRSVKTIRRKGNVIETHEHAGDFKEW